MYFASFVDQEFETIYNNANKRNTRLFLQDGDPSQNSAKAQASLQNIDAELLKIPPRSPDLSY